MKQQLQDNPELIEALAQLEHEQWSHWINYQLKECAIDHEIMTKEECEQARDKWEAWVDLANTPYNKLTAQQRKTDREWARKAYNIIIKAVLGALDP